MGGSILFIESTEFDPKIYGLIPGKFINYIIIGGGGAGGSGGEYRYKKTTSGSIHELKGSFDIGGVNGQSSSIGDYVTVSGGINGVGNIRPKWFDNNGDTRYFDYIDGGNGASGWIPGKIFNSSYKGLYPIGLDQNSLSGTTRFKTFIDGNYKIVVDNVGYTDSPSMTSYPLQKQANLIDPTLSRYQQYHQSFGKPNPYKKDQVLGVLSQGDDGIGYGAGGGGHAEWKYDGDGRGGQGGNSGEFKMGSFKLNSVEIIPIIIGEGGTPHTTFSTLIDQNYLEVENLNSYLGMTGTPGAVMLFWD